MIKRLILNLTAVLFAVSTLYSNTVDKDSAHLKLKQAVSLHRNGNWIGALEELHEFIDDYWDEDDVENIGDCAHAYMFLGNIHMSFKDFINAREFYLKSNMLADQIGDNDLLMKNHFNLAVLSSQTADTVAAYEYLRKGFSVDVRNKNEQRVIFMYTDAYLERKFGDWKSAVHKFHNSLAEIEKTKSSEIRRATPLSELTEIYEDRGMVDSAKLYIEEYQDIAARYHIPDMLTDCMRLKMRLFTLLSHPDSAIFYQDKYFRLRDSIFNTGNFLDIVANIQNKKDEKKAIAFAGMKDAVHSRTIVILCLIGFALVVLAFALLLIRQNRRLRESYVKLYEKDNELNKIEDLMQSGVPEPILSSPDQPCSPESDTIQASDTSTRGDQPISADRLYPGLKRKIQLAMNDSNEWTKPDFCLQRLAELTGSNTHYVSQVINDCFNKNFRSFLNSYRIRRACQIINESDPANAPTIQVISENVGFRSVSSFIAAFKKQTGLTPSFYQKLSASMSDMPEVADITSDSD